MKLGEAERDQKAPNLLVSPIPALILALLNHMVQMQLPAQEVLKLLLARSRGETLTVSS